MKFRPILANLGSTNDSQGGFVSCPGQIGFFLNRYGGALFDFCD